MGMGSPQSSLNAAGTSSMAVLRESHVSAFLCTLIVALGPIQFGFTGSYSSPTQASIRILATCAAAAPAPAAACVAAAPAPRRPASPLLLRRWLCGASLRREEDEVEEVTVREVKAAPSHAHAEPGP
ncbi:unnamed protein product [Miscanthus lutarioriparius]|uniref:Uncharacterized protein n=1 Tax=Miscanthus lutarioriparius TaxID=422564 RepID=A0A811REC0_9POAL|nr:unnamed protein product [Miscanthus lutarioriparius]